ncbi:Tannase/feruloyl esterase [Xylaria arbuscula]|nr:Tannase/feruloyl esterase [Xylaria arbuscula]
MFYSRPAISCLWAGFALSVRAKWADPDLSQVAFGANGLCKTDLISYPEVEGLQILSLSATELRNHTFMRNPLLGSKLGPIEGVSFCNVSVIYTHPGWNDTIRITTYLPLVEQYNGKFQANGGGGWVTGGESLAEFTMIPSLLRGFAVSTTDGGHSDNMLDQLGSDMPWAHSSPGNINWPLLLDFSYLALHEMSIVGKALVKSFYGTPPKYSYFYGASTGGRQAHMLAQRYPEDFDGILAVSPAINWTKFLWSAIWPMRTMDKTATYPRPCEFEAISAAAMKACDGLDGVEDGVISMPSRCYFDPHVLVGDKFDCNGIEAKFTSVAADTVFAAWTGPRSSTGEFQWHGFPKDAHLWGPLAPILTTCDEDDKCIGSLFPISDTWVRYFVAKNPGLDVRTLSHQQWDNLFLASTNEYDSVIGTSDPDLSRFGRAEAKMITWHGMADQVIPVNGTIDYAKSVLEKDPKAHDYYRLFLAPGADHSMDWGLAPTDPLTALIDWVEHGKSPQTLRVAGLNAYGTHVERDICMYPQVQHYAGGDPTLPSSFICV